MFGVQQTLRVCMATGIMFPSLMIILEKYGSISCEIKRNFFGHFKDFKAMAGKEKGMQIKTLRLDEGGEYFSNDFSSFCKSIVYAGGLHAGILHNKMEL